MSGRVRLCLALLCSLVSLVRPAEAHTDITAGQARDMIAAGGVIVLDVRENSEFCGFVEHIEDAANLPWNSEVLNARYGLFPVDAEIIVVCASGNRSNQASNFLDSQGYSNVYDMLGGMGGWTYGTEACDSEPALRLGKPAADSEINWTPTDGVQDYDLLKGFVDNIAVGSGFIDLGATECLADDSPFTYYIDPEIPFPGSCRFYLARHITDTWGESSGRLGRLPGGADCQLP
jgi:rhodanese-related sulfurtransferase